MTTTLVDDRKPRERKTHSVIITMIDTFMTGWGEAKGTNSLAGWACRPEHADQVREWVENRSDSHNVREEDGDWTPPNGTHCHIYVVNPGHPALV